MKKFAIIFLVLMLGTVGQTGIIQPVPYKIPGFVAAYNASIEEKAVAQYICDGVDDQIQIQAAHDTLDPNYGGRIQLSSGQFNISPSPQFDNKTCLRFNRLLTLEGEGADHTVIYLADGSDCNMIELDSCITNNPISAFRHFRLHGNRDNNAGNLYGIIQLAHVTYGWVDIQFEDLWIDRINGVGISLRHYWDHRIERCVFEHLDDAAIELNTYTGTTLGNIWITNTFALDIPQFIKIGTAETGGQISNVIIEGSQIVTGNARASDHFLELPTCIRVKIKDNSFIVDFSDADTYSVIKLDYTASAPTIMTMDVSIINNSIYTNTVDAKYGIWIQTYIATGITQTTFKIESNYIAAGTTAAIMDSETDYRHIRKFSITNNIIFNGGNGIYINSGMSGTIRDNDLYNTGSNSITCEYLYDGVIENNYLAKPLNLCVPDVYLLRVNNNRGPGSIQTVTSGAQTLWAFEKTKLNSNAGAITGTLGDGYEVGSMKTIVMSDANNASTVSVAHHTTSDPEIGTFDSVDDVWILMWTGTDWTTVAATCSFD